MEYILRMLCGVSVTVGDDDIIPAEKLTAERAILREYGGMSDSEKTSIIHVIDPI